MKFLIADIEGYYDNGTMQNKHYSDMLSKICNISNITSNDKEYIIAEINDINSLMELIKTVKTTIIIGEDLDIPQEIKKQIDSTIIIQNGYM